MPLVTSRKMLLDAQKKGYAVGAFNMENMEMAQAIVEAAQQLGSPVILQTTPSTIRYGGLRFFYSIAVAASQATVPVAVHLDHGDSFALAAQAMREGYTSVMIDGSHLPIDDNIALTKSVVAFCAPSDIPVEGELGRVGGKEDSLEGTGDGYTDPADAARFTAETGVSSLAVGIGTAHGVYKTVPILNLALLTQIRNIVDVPLVLHGASGLSDEAVRDCINRGICKVNFATELRIAFSDAVKQLLSASPETIDPKRYLSAGRQAVKKIVMNRIEVCGCAGRA